MSDLPLPIVFRFIGTPEGPVVWARALEAKPIDLDAPEDRDVWHEFSIGQHGAA